MDGLKAVVNVGTDMVNSNGTVLIPHTAASNFLNGGYQTQYDMQKSNQLIEGFLNYSNADQGGDHRLDLTAGYSFQEWSTLSPSYAGLNIAGDTLNAPGIPTDTKNALLSYYGRGIYSFLDKYVVTATLRRDGSSRFSPEKTDKKGCFSCLDNKRRDILKGFRFDILFKIQSRIWCNRPTRYIL